LVHGEIPVINVQWGDGALADAARLQRSLASTLAVAKEVGWTSFLKREKRFF
jgi:hypothetical protein